MLVLSRFQGEKILITTPTGETITIVVSSIQLAPRSKVRIALDAPKDYVILRAELQNESEVPCE